MTTNYPPDHHIWNPLFMLVFFVALVAVYRVVVGDFGYPRELLFMSWFDVSVIGLATYRLIRLLSFDRVFFFVRALFFNKVGENRYEAPARGFRRAVVELLECIWCTGIWSALAAMGLYLLSPLGRFFVILLAVAAIGSFLQNLGMMISRIGEK